MSTDAAIEEAARSLLDLCQSRQLGQAAAAKKCSPCGCLHDSLRAIEHAFPEAHRPPVLDAAIRAARERLTDVRYDCLGCEVCFPALAINALNRERGEDRVNLAACPTERVDERPGWPPPGEMAGRDEGRITPLSDLSAIVRLICRNSLGSGSLTCHSYCPASGSRVSFQVHVVVMTIRPPPIPVDSCRSTCCPSEVHGIVGSVRSSGSP